MQSHTFTVTGPFCGTCLAELLERVRAIRGVSGAAAGLPGDGTAVMVLDGPSPLDGDLVRVAVEQAGFSLAPDADPGWSTRRRDAQARILRRDLTEPRRRTHSHR